MLSLKGCQIVAGGRSVAQTTGQQSKIIPHPERVLEKRWHPSGVRTTWALLSGGLRYAATTGYYLTALQAEIRAQRFHTVSKASGQSNRGTVRYQIAVYLGATQYAGDDL